MGQPRARATLQAASFARSLAAAILLLGYAFILEGQTDEQRREFFRPDPRWWSIDLDVSGVFDDNIDRDDERKRRVQGVVPRLVTRVADRSGRSRFSLRYGAGAQAYSEPDQPRGAVSDLDVTFERRFGPRASRVVVGAEGEHSFRVSSDDNELTNQFKVSPFIEKQWGSTRLGGYSGYRFKRVADDVGDESIRMLGAELAQDLGDGHAVGLGYRHETSDSNDPRRRYTRSTYAADYTAKLGARDRLRLDIELRERRFSQRFSRVNGARVPRADFHWIPSVFWVHDFSVGHQLRLGYQLERRASNDPDKEFQAHRVEFGVRFALSGHGLREDPRPLLKRDGTGMDLGPRDARSGSIVLDQVRLLSASAGYDRKEGQAFTKGSSWQDLLQSQGVPSNISERPAFFEEIWFYGSSWVVLKDGRVKSWHDAGNLSSALLPQESSSSVAATGPTRVFPKVPYRTPALAEIAAEPNGKRVAPSGSSEPVAAVSGGPAGDEAAAGDESLSAALYRARPPVVVLKVGTRIEGVIQKYEKGLAYIILTRGPRGKMMLTTVPEPLVDKEATQAATLGEESLPNPR